MKCDYELKASLVRHLDESLKKKGRISVVSTVLDLWVMYLGLRFVSFCSPARVMLPK